MPTVGENSDLGFRAADNGTYVKIIMWSSEEVMESALAMCSSVILTDISDLYVMMIGTTQKLLQFVGKSVKSFSSS